MFNLVVLLDLKKAFDTVNHDIFVRKFELYGINDSALTMIGGLDGGLSRTVNIKFFSKLTVTVKNLT